MKGRTTRSVFKQGGSHLITLPRDWILKQDKVDYVHLIYDDVILVFSDNQLDRVNALFEKLIHKVVEDLKPAEVGP